MVFSYVRILKKPVTGVLAKTFLEGVFEMRNIFQNGKSRQALHRIS